MVDPSRGLGRIWVSRDRREYEVTKGMTKPRERKNGMNLKIQKVPDKEPEKERGYTIRWVARNEGTREIQMIADIQANDTLRHPISLAHSTATGLGAPDAMDWRVQVT